ncbi:MAG: exopolyphosphatase [Bacteroidetes bacterium]|nr:exopolyphosphatase [Bacteroidota bacterium]
MKYGAIDIGTNAARLLVGELTRENGHTFIKKVSYTRIPLRLGEDVFENGKISKKKAENFIKTIQAFRLVAEIFDVKELRACATSAMREATNGLKIKEQIEQETGVTIEVISGDQEAELIFSTFSLFQLDKTIPFVVIDVGGGSTEVSVFEEGERVASKSFEIGTLRMVKGKVRPEIWKEMSVWLKENVALSSQHRVYGTGGNINKAHKLVGGQHLEPVSLKKLEELRDALEPLTVSQRVEKFQLKPDRADVLVPAMEIYVFIMRELKSRQIYVPKIGLSDGIVLQLHNSQKRKKLV